jgi:16S rRNA (cytosine1402-N4)-methyltransferase
VAEPSPEQPNRRVRYRGKNPRSFGEKYKELQPDRYPVDVAKVVAAGKTPAGTHRPIMVSEILHALKPNPGDTAVDCTLGYGGHASMLLEAIQPGGKLLGMDVDPIELPKTEARLRSLGYPDESVVVQRTNFASLNRMIASFAPGGVQMILADLGLSSMQIDDPVRGFSFKFDGPLDMRMNPNRGRSASELLSTLDATQLALLMETNSDEPKAQRLSRAILDAHSKKTLDSTLALAKVIRISIESQQHCGTEEATDSIRRVFQSLRIEVNDEFRVLDTLLKLIPTCLATGGRVAILAFHSGEDRRVKNALKEGLRNGDYAAIADDMVRPSMQEQGANPRSTSAKLRFATRA